MKNTVDKLRRLPIKERRSLLHFAMICCSLIIFGLWTLTLRHDLQSPETQAKLRQSAEPFVDLGGQMAGSYNAFQSDNSSAEFSNGINQLQSTIEDNAQR